MFGVAAIAVGSDGLERVIIGKDEQDIRLLGFSKSDGCRGDKESSEEYGKLAHREMGDSNDSLTRLEANRARAKAIVRPSLSFRHGSNDFLQSGGKSDFLSVDVKPHARAFTVFFPSAVIEDG